MDAHAQAALGQLLHRETVVDLGGGGVVDGEGRRRRQRQIGRRVGRLQAGRKAAPGGEVLALEEREVQRAGIGKQAPLEEQAGWRQLERGAGLIERHRV